ncbi:MAG: PH domain-containing protein [Bacteroidota bacterium]
MDDNFSKPQRQSAAGIIIMAANTAQHLIRALFIPLIIFIVKADKEAISYITIGSVILVVIIIVFSYFEFRKFTFFLDEAKQEFIINKGIFNKTLLSIRLDKIQQVNINQSLLQKVIGVYSLQIDTPGSKRKEVVINAIDEKIAYRLKDHLLNGKQETLRETQSTPNKIPFLKISENTLFKIGLTSNYGRSFWLLVGFVLALFHNVKELLKALNADNGQIENVIKSGFTLFSISLLTISLLFILLAVNLIRTFVKYFDFEISEHQHSLLISAGFFAKKNTLLSPKKVQITAYSQNYFQRKFNLLTLLMKQAHDGHAENEKESHKTNLEVPGCNREEKEKLLSLILGKIPPQGKTFIPNYRFLNLPFFFRVAIPIGVFIILYANFEAVKPFYALAIFYFIVAVLMIYRSYRTHRLEVSEDFIIKKSGIWDISHEIILPHKIQAITTFQYPWHKGVDVGHVNLHTAAGIIHFKYGNYTEIKELVNYWLYQIESGSEEWM